MTQSVGVLIVRRCLLYGNRFKCLVFKIRYERLEDLYERQ